MIDEGRKVALQLAIQAMNGRDPELVIPLAMEFEKFLEPNWEYKQKIARDQLRLYHRDATAIKQSSDWMKT